MTGKFLSFFAGGFLISLIVFSQVVAKADYIPSGGGGEVITTPNDNNLKAPEEEESFPKVLSKRSKSVLEELKRKKEKLLGRRVNPDPGSESGVKVPERESPVDNIIHLGCIAPYENQRTNWGNPRVPLDESFTRATCALQCLQMGIQMQLVFLKGAECRCATTFIFDSKWVDPERCNVPCPVKDFGKKKNAEEENGMCGGNRGYSVYCIPVPGQEDCNSVRTSSSPQDNDKVMKAYPPEVEIDSTSLFQPPPAQLGMIMEEPCTVCNYGRDALCRKPYHDTEFDYFPANSPEACVEYCGTTVRFVANVPNNNEKIRPPTTYAMLTFVAEPSSRGNVNLPICRCVKQGDRDLFGAVDEANCAAGCPGEPGSICGGLQINKMIYYTVYCVNGEEGHCRLPPTTTTMEPEPQSPSTTEIQMTTEGEDQDPCVLGLADCDDVGNSSTTTDEEEWVTTETSTATTTTTTVTPTTTTTTPTTTPTTTSTTETTTTSTTSTTPPPTTTTSTTTTERTTTIPPNLNCSVSCQKTDLYGYNWTACAGARAQTGCSNLAKNATGMAYWNCLGSGEFETSQPDVRGCESPWVRDCLKDVETIEEIGRASEFMEYLEDACRDAKRPASGFKYFGRQINNITYMVDQVLFKVRNFPDQRSKFSPSLLEQIIQNAVNINAFLIQYRDPWEFLQNSDRSSASNYIFQTTESALFNLTEEFKGQAHKQIFSLPDAEEDELFKFLILAETFSKAVEGGRQGEEYEFPPHENRAMQDSFIRMPPDWRKLVTSEDVEIAAMSIDAEYVSYVMPGQFDDLTSSPQLEGEDECESKLVNGKLISLSVASSSSSSGRRQALDPRMSFNGKGAEIVFYHDIEAWGKERQDVPRRLHNKEKPGAVLGSTQCVFWDTTKLTWSTSGCRVVSSNRFRTICECSHLTSFAVLMDVHRYIGKQFGLQLVTLILCPLSEICLILSIVILSSVNNLQRIRTTITKNLSGCLFIGNGMVLFVLDRNYFNMSDGLCVGSAMLTHYIFLCAFMWMLIEGVQLYRMVVHVFDSGKSFMKHFAVFAYGSPLLIVTITATTGYLQGDTPYGGDVYCWLDGSYIWSFMAPVAIIIMINLVILFIALKTAYQLQQGKSKQPSPTFFNGKIRSYKTWFKGCFSLTCILGLTWVVGFFMLMRSSTGVVAAYLFTILNSSQGIFIFLFNCVFNEKVRLSTKRNLSVYLPSWLSSSTASTPGNEPSIYGKRPISPAKSMTEASSGLSERKRSSKEPPGSGPAPPQQKYMNIPKARLSTVAGGDSTVNHRGPPFKVVDFDDLRTVYSDGNGPVEKERSGSTGTVSSVESLPNSNSSSDDNGHNSASDTSQSALISALRSKLSKTN